MPHKPKKQAKSTLAGATASTDLEFLPAATEHAIEEEIERGFFERALRLVTDPSWGRYRSHAHGPRLACREFTAQYTDLLVWAFGEYIGFLAKVAVKLGVRLPWYKAESAGFRFLERFVTDIYRHPWTGDFLHGREWISAAHADAAYRMLHEFAPWLDIRIVTPDTWERVFFGELRSKSSPWRQHAIGLGKHKARLITATTIPEKPGRRKVAPIELDPPPWTELQKKKAIRRSAVVAYSRRTDRTIRDYIRRGRLHATKAGWVICDGKLLSLLRHVLGDAYR